MPRRSYPWALVDEAARLRAAGLIDESGLSYRLFADETDGLMKYSRVRDIRLGKSAPMRLSEFLAICDVCNTDPIRLLRQIMDDVKHGKAVGNEADLGTTRAKYRAMHIDSLGLAAKHGDAQAEQEAYEEMP